MKRIGKFLLFIAVCIVLFLCSLNIGKPIGTWKIPGEKLGDMKVKWNSEVGEKIADLSYGNKAANRYDLYLPADDQKEAYSLILHIHGGGFNSGDKSEGEILCRYFASKGYVTAAVNYSLMDETHESNINVMYDETVKALDTILKDCEQRGYHISEMATTGESAGGCLAMLFAFRYGNECPIPIRFVMEESGPASFEPSLWADADIEGQISYVNSMTGRNFTLEDHGTEDYQKAIDEISPVSYIDENTIPLLMAYGSKDKIVPPGVKVPLLEKLDEHHVTYQYIEFPNSGHGLLGDPDKLLEYHKAMLEYCEKFFKN